MSSQNRPRERTFQITHSLSLREDHDPTGVWALSLLPAKSNGEALPKCAIVSVGCVLHLVCAFVGSGGYITEPLGEGEGQSPGPDRWGLSTFTGPHRMLSFLLRSVPTALVVGLRSFWGSLLTSIALGDPGAFASAKSGSPPSKNLRGLTSSG